MHCRSSNRLVKGEKGIIYENRDLANSTLGVRINFADSSQFKNVHVCARTHKTSSHELNEATSSSNRPLAGSDVTETLP